MKSFAFAAMLLSAANAYDTTLSDCESFAAQFNGTCGGEDEGDAYPDDQSSWGTGVDITCTGDTVNCLGSDTNSCTVTRKNCVTCRQSSSLVYIRFQSNGMPNHCYGADSSTYPASQHVDFEVSWNEWVVGETNYSSS